MAPQLTVRQSLNSITITDPLILVNPCWKYLLLRTSEKFDDFKTSGHHLYAIWLQREFPYVTLKKFVSEILMDIFDVVG